MGAQRQARRQPNKDEDEDESEDESEKPVGHFNIMAYHCSAEWNGPSESTYTSAKGQG
jgi:hypothetical protein